jgi:NADH-ubiquinone oxidoreductase chain 3
MLFAAILFICAFSAAVPPAPKDKIESPLSLFLGGQSREELWKDFIAQLNEESEFMDNIFFGVYNARNGYESATVLQGIRIDLAINGYESAFLSEFAPICIYLVISLLVSLILLGVPFLFASNSSTYPEKLSAYECGFDPFGDARSRFDIRFYLVSILFIIFDLEVTFFFPWAVPPNKIDLFGSWSMMAFLLILTIGFLYEWKRGASDRE